jgi:CRISPR-associated protein Csx17
MTSTSMRARHVLPGLRPEPLASYLAGLGLIRTLGEQADPDATAAWADDGLALMTTVPDIAAWLACDYIPTPVLSPWNNGSGFGLKDKESRRVLNELRDHPSPRLAHFRDAIRLAEQVAGRARDQGWITETGSGDKARLVKEFRNRCPDTLLPWIDAAVVLAGDDTFFPPLLGTGGNDGRLDFSTNFHQRLLEVIGTAGEAGALAQARDLLDGTEAERLATAAVGQFDPGGAGGPGSSRFGAADSLVNPWEFILLVEGSLLFAASAVRRNQHYRQGEERAAIPFTVQPSPNGSDSGAAGEESRGELWAPVWQQQFTLPEIKQLFGEARASWRGRPARRAVDFYAATRTLGVARGVSEFTRYGLQRRNGLAFAAVPVDRIDVREKQAVRLAADVEDWISWVRTSDASTAVAEAVRRFDAAHLKYARDGDTQSLAQMLAELTGVEQAVGRSGRARERIPVRRPPAAQKFLDVMTDGASAELGIDASAQLRIAAGLASCMTTVIANEMGGPARTLRQILLPVDPPGPTEGRRSAGRWRDSAAEQDQETFRGVPTFRSRLPVPAADLHAFAMGAIDDALDVWLRACLALDWSRARKEWPTPNPGILVPTLGLLHPLALGLTSAEARKAARIAASSPDPNPHDVGDEPRLALRPDWAARLAAGQVRAVHGEAVDRLRQAGWNAVPAPPDPMASGVSIAAALVPRCLRPWRVLRRLASPIRESEETEISTSDEPEPEEQS